MSFHENNYVIDRHTGHPGYENFTIVSTPEHMTALVDALSRALANKTSNGRLWSGNATLARGKTSRIYLSFALTPDLHAFHQQPGFIKRFTTRSGWVLVLAVLYFTWIGLSTTVQQLFN